MKKITFLIATALFLSFICLGCSKDEPEEIIKPEKEDLSKLDLSKKESFYGVWLIGDYNIVDEWEGSYFIRIKPTGEMERLEYPNIYPGTYTFENASFLYHNAREEKHTIRFSFSHYNDEMLKVKIDDTYAEITTTREDFAKLFSRDLSDWGW